MSFWYPKTNFTDFETRTEDRMAIGAEGSFFGSRLFVDTDLALLLG